jgi:hypothetical protein
VRVQTAQIIRRPLCESIVDGGINSQEDLFTGTHGVLVERPGVNYGRGGLVAAQYDQQVAHHGGLAFFV